jgi:hypothetical protein
MEKKQLVIFASEIPDVLGFNHFVTKAEAIHKIKSRKVYARRKQEIVVRKLQCLKIEDDDEQKEVTLSRLLATTPPFDITISGRFLLSRKTDGRKVISMTRTRQKDITKRIWDNDACLAQTYLWLLNEENSMVKFREESEISTSTFVEKIYPDPQFEAVQLECLQMILHEEMIVEKEAHTKEVHKQELHTKELHTQQLEKEEE